MKIEVVRYSDNGDSTMSLIFIDGQFQCYGLEDEFREKKVRGETRIPEGIYPIKLRKEGGFHNRYSKTFSEMHEGMLHITNVPNFKWVLIHCGNTDEHTAGCLLVGDQVNNNQIGNGFLSSSRPAYRLLYPKVLSELKKGNTVEIEFRTL